MPYNGRLLARARDALSNIRRENEQTLRQRRAEVFRRMPEIREIDKALTKQIIDLSLAALQGGGNIERVVSSAEARSKELEQKRESLLRSAGYPADYIDEIYACTVCSDTGYVGQEVCACLKKLYDRELARDLSSLPGAGAESFLCFDLGYYSASRDPVTGESPRECMETIVSVCRKYAEKFGGNSENLLFQGGAGRGKTYLAVCVARAVAALGFSVVYETAVGAVANFETQRFQRGSEMSEAAGAQIRRYLDSDLLIIDDLGTEITGGFSASSIYSLLNSRMISGGKMIVCTILGPDELRRRYSPQIVSRLEGEFLSLSFVGSDIRAIKKARGLE